MQEQKRRRVARACLSIEKRQPIDLDRAIRSLLLHETL